ncbi:Glycine--tRNA ligase beta subunit [compost metagenome]
MAAVSSQDDFKTTVESFGRVSNLAAKASAEKVRSDLLNESAESQLYEAWKAVTSKYREALNERDAAAALQLIAGLKSSITVFFDSVMVMAEDETVRSNRLALLKAIDEDLRLFADFSKLVWA